MTAPRETDFPRDIEHGGVVCPINGMPDGCPLGLGRRKLGRKRHRFVRRQGQIIGTDLAGIL